MSLGPSIIHLRFKGFKVIRIPEVSLLKNSFTFTFILKNLKV